MSKPILTVSDFSRLLKKDVYGAFLFFGQEAYLKHHALQSARQKIVTDASLAVFNHIVLKEDAATPIALLQAIATPPMMAEQKLIEVHSVDFTSLTQEELRAWEQAVEGADSPDTCVIFYAEDEELQPEKDALPKSLSAFCEVVQPVAFPLQSRMQLTKWIARHFQEENITFSPDFPNALLDYCGSDMSTLGNEIQKMVAYLHFHGQTEAEITLISKLCAAHPARDPFDFTNAILDANTKKAFELFAEMKAKKERPELILGSISHVVCDLAKVKVYASAGRTQAEIAKLMKSHVYRIGLYQKQAQKRTAQELKRAVLLCAEADRTMKTALGDPYLVLEKLIVELGARAR